ncbi:hypothetical protein [Flavobacterium rhizosphaerae]|uniref:Uncharacterized protein n=1 Tax=Flavobacterium rhizosphaerae TaxID=3163298 RepID=A0ABW8YXJ1_9FLAO
MKHLFTLFTIIFCNLFAQAQVKINLYNSTGHNLENIIIKDHNYDSLNIGESKLIEVGSIHVLGNTPYINFSAMVGGVPRKTHKESLGIGSGIKFTSYGTYNLSIHLINGQLTYGGGISRHLKRCGNDMRP